MKIPTLPFTVTDWSQVAATTHPGETGEALWRTLDIGDLRVRMVEYSAGYLADHWCDRGHVLYGGGERRAGVDDQHRQPARRISLPRANQLVEFQTVYIAVIARGDRAAAARHQDHARARRLRS